ncbi:MAG TPA: glycosyltransferase family 2 protein [Leptolyngbyaceae cyanobacterium]
MIPKISVIIPAYNAEKYIAKAIESVLEQTEKSIEAIVVDDGSTDSTVEIVKSFSDPRLRLIINQDNRGVSYSRNRALTEARGEWVAILDADDWYAPERVEKLLQVASAENVDIIADDLYFVEYDAIEPSSTLLCVDKENFNQVKFIDTLTFVELNMKPASISPHLGLAKPLFNRNFLLKNNLKYDEDLHYIEDFSFYLMCLLKGAKFVITPEPYYFYRRYHQGATSTVDRIERLEKSRQAYLYVLQNKSVRNHPIICSAIEKNLIKINQELAYSSTIQSIKDKKWLEAGYKTISDPNLVVHFMKKFGEIIRKQFITIRGVILGV